MIEVKDQRITVELDKEGSKLLTNAIFSLIEKKSDNICRKKNCDLCKDKGSNVKENDIEKLATEILDLYFLMYKISMSTTDIPSIIQIKDNIELLTNQ